MPASRNCPVKGVHPRDVPLSTAGDQGPLALVTGLVTQVLQNHRD